MADERYQNRSRIRTSPTERERAVAVLSETPSEESMTEISVRHDCDGDMCLYVKRSSKQKYGGKRWHSVSAYVSMSPEAWAHLISAPTAEDSTNG